MAIFPADDSWPMDQKRVKQKGMSSSFWLHKQ
jgi:hypothetical protein